MNPRSTDREADALTTTPSRRLSPILKAQNAEQHLFFCSCLKTSKMAAAALLFLTVHLCQHTIRKALYGRE